MKFKTPLLGLLFLTLFSMAAGHAQIAPTVTFTGAPATAPYLSSFTVVATSNSGVTPTLTTTGVCSLSGSTVTMSTASGTCTMTAKWAANGNYLAASATQTTMAEQAPTTVVWSTPGAITYGAPLKKNQLNATATPVSNGTYVYTPPLGTVLNAGSQTLSVQFTPNDAKYASSSGNVTLQVNPASQTITFPSIPSQPYSPTPITLNATANSGLTVTFAITSGPATISGNMLTLTGVGPITVQASQAGNADYQAATPVSRTFTVSPASQTITYTQSAPASAPYNSAFTVAATASSGLPVSFSSSGVCSNVGGTFTMTNSSGTCKVIASQSGNADYLAAATVTESTTASQAAQIVTFTGAPATAAYLTTFAVAAMSNSGITPTIAVSGACAIAGATVTMTSGTGICTVTANWAGSSYYLPASATQATTAVQAATTVVWPSPAAIIYGTPLSATQLNATATPVSAGSFVYTPPAGTVPGAGSQTLSVQFTPTNGNYASSAGTVPLQVNPGAASIAVSVNPTNEDYGLDAPVTITAVLTWNGSGVAPTSSAVTIGGNGPSVYGATSCGVPSGMSMTCTAIYTPTVADAEGSYTETATFTGDANYSGSTSSQTNNFAINQASASTIVISNSNPSTYGQAVTFTATISGENGLVKGRRGKNGGKPRDVSGSVTWSANTDCGTTPVTTGNPAVATCTTSVLAAGPDVVTATYSGDSNHAGSTGTLSQVVNPRATSIGVSVSPTSEDYGLDAPVTITAVLTWSGSGVAPTASAVAIGGNGPSAYGATSCGAPSGLSMTCTATYTPTVADAEGSYTETATFTGDANYSGSTSSQTNNFAINQASASTIVISNSNPSTYGQAVTFTATIGGENGLVKGRRGKNGGKPRDVSGSVTWSANTGCGTTPVTTGNPAVATCTTSVLAAGSDVVTATYSGDSNHAGSTGTLSQVVNLGATSIGVSVSPTSEDYGFDAPVTITAVLTWNGSGVAPTASAVTIGGNGPSVYRATSCGAPSGMSMTCTATYTPTVADAEGSYTETATFAGDANYSGSTSSQTSNFTINQSASTTVISNLNPSTYGQAVTFTATISGENSLLKGRKKHGGKPRDISGSVTWSANTNCGTTPVTAGSPAIATCTTSVLAAGSDVITATYSGDSNDSGSTASLSQTVNPASQTITFTVPPPPTASSSDHFTVAATVGASGNVVTFAVGGGSVCTLAGATYTMTSNSGFCYVIANQSGNSNYLPATSTETVTAAKSVTRIAPTVSFTGAPASAAYGSTFTVTATANSGVPPQIAATGACTISGTTVAISSGIGVCTLSATWAANTYYLAASAQQVTTAVKAAQGASFTGAPSTAPYQSTFTVAALANSGITPMLAVAGKVCSISGNVVVMTNSVGTCTLTATWGATNNYLPASATQSVIAQQAATTITWAAPAPITYPARLGATQLNAVAGIPGKFVYSPAPGTVLAGGNYTLSVEFTPTSSHFAPSTASVPLTVDQALTITSASSMECVAGTAESFTVTTTGFPVPALSVSGVLPTGLTFTDNGNGTAILQGIPTPGVSGNYNLSIAAQNGVSNATQSFSLTVNLVSAMVAARFLEQSSWGPTPATIAQVQASDLSTYLQQQFSAPISVYSPVQNLTQAQEQFFTNAMQGQDQLRQRVSFALSEIMVISNRPDSISYTAFPLWMNTLQKDAFGNFDQLITDVTLSPGMGTYLNMAQNNGCGNCRPNENFAREALQLFSIGLSELNPDGSLVLDGNGDPIPTYTQGTVDGFSQVFTGWAYPPASTQSTFFNPPYFSGPMVPFQQEYNTGSKLLLDGVTLFPGGNIVSDLGSALQNISNHPNVGPFLCKQLIQKLVTSNPIPSYISRCSQAFNDDGTGVRGNLQAVVSEILLDSEARRGDNPAQVLPADGHLREPLLYMMFVLRALNATTNGSNLPAISQGMEQAPFSPPSVFNFYPPSYAPPGFGILGPELAILDNGSLMARANFINNLLYGSMAPNTVINIAPYVAAAGNVPTLLNMINSNLMHGAMPADMYSTLLSTLSNPAFSTPAIVAKAALYLVLTSSQFNVEN